MIILYTSPGCGPCAVTKRALERAGLAYEERAGADWPDEVERLAVLAGSSQARQTQFQGGSGRRSCHASQRPSQREIVAPR